MPRIRDEFDQDRMNDVYIEDSPRTIRMSEFFEPNAEYDSFIDRLDEQAFDEAWANKPIIKGRKNVPLGELKDRARDSINFVSKERKDEQNE